jgi:hypothetical protein
MACVMHFDVGMTCCCRHARHMGATHGTPTIEVATDLSKETAIPRWWIDVTLGDRTARVEPRNLVQVRLHGVDVVRLDDLWESGHLGVRAAALAFDFIGDDGFSVRDKVPAGIAGRDLVTGYACVSTRDLVWQPAPSRPCFWRVKRVARVVAFEPST